MSNPQKSKGDAFERGQRDHADAAGVPTKRTKAGYERDAGDLHFYWHPGGIRPPLAVGQCKATPKSYDLPAFLRGAEQQRAEAGARWGVAIVKRRGVTDPGEQFVAMNYTTWLGVLELAALGLTHLNERSA